MASALRLLFVQSLCLSALATGGAAAADSLAARDPESATRELVEMVPGFIDRDTGRDREAAQLRRRTGRPDDAHRFVPRPAPPPAGGTGAVVPPAAGQPAAPQEAAVPAR